MFALVRNDRIERIIHAHESLLLDGIRYPAGWLELADPATRASLGIVPVEEEPEPDPFWFVTSKQRPVLDGEKVVMRWEKVSRPVGDLKSACEAKLRRDANHILFPTDWMVVRAAEGGAAVPPAITAWRQRVRDEMARVEHLVMRGRDAVEMMVAMRGLAWPKFPDNT